MAGKSPAPGGDEFFMKESLRSYQKCHVANAARRNSLMKKTHDIETQRRLASSQMSREERQLRDHLKEMKIHQSKPTVVTGGRGE